MQAVTVVPGQVGSDQLDEWPEPDRADGAVLVQTLAVGICGTDHEILRGEHGEAPDGSDRLVLGHEAVGRVLEPAAGLAAGDLVVPIVRRPDPVPCRNCAAGEWDMCRNGQYTEHGISGLHGFARSRFRADADALVPVDPDLGELAVLLEPTSVVAKAWEHLERIGSRAVWEPETVLVTGAGPIGLLAALLGTQRGLDVHVLDQVTDGPKPELVRRLGATYSATPVDELDLEADVVIECTGAAAVIAGVLGGTARNAVVCLTGVSAPGATRQLDVGALNRERVLENDVVFGTVNANRRHYEQGAAALSAADPSWLASLVTRRVPVAAYAEALEQRDGDVKTVLTF